jgi:hypothetical protein
LRDRAGFRLLSRARNRLSSQSNFRTSAPVEIDCFAGIKVQ